MLFAIIGTDGPRGQALRPSLRQAHLDRIDALARDGRLVLAGPFSDGSGSLVVIEAPSLEEARAFAEGDPYVTGGVFQSIDVRPFIQVRPVP
ncbi:MAG: YciI family protein [Nitrospirota bacterium]